MRADECASALILSLRDHPAFPEEVRAACERGDALFGIAPGLLALIGAALLFDYLNGFHDSSNIVATMISSRSMSPRRALGLSALAHFVATLLFGTAVAKTVAPRSWTPAPFRPQ
jgi:hypothetical protein